MFHNVHPKNCIGKLDRIYKFCHILQGRVESLRFPPDEIDANNARADLLEALHQHTSMGKDFMHALYGLGERTLPRFYWDGNAECFYWSTELGFARESWQKKSSKEVWDAREPQKGMDDVLEELSKVHAANKAAMGGPMDFRLAFARISKDDEEKDRKRQDKLMKMG